MKENLYIIKNKKLRIILLSLLIFIGVLGIGDTLLLIPVTSSVTLGMALPAAMGVAFIAIGIFNLTKRKPFFKSKLLLKIVAGVLIFATLFFFTVEAFIWSAANDNAAETTSTNFIIVLGCGIFPDGTLTLTLMNRLDAAYDYMIENEHTICVVSGGQGANEPRPEGEAMKEYLVEKGIDESRILEENYATSTMENLVYSSDIMYSYNPCIEQSVAIVTSEFHVFRAKFLAKRFGMDAIGIPTETPWYIRPNCYLREFFGVIKSYFLDKI